MANFYQLEISTDLYLLEDGSGFYELEGVYLSPTAIGSEEAFGTASISTTITITPPTPSISSAEQIGNLTVIRGAVTVSPSSIASAEAFGTATVTVGAVTVNPSSIASAEAFGTATVTVGAVTVSPSSIASEEAFGSHLVVAGSDLSPAGIGSEEDFGTATILAGAITVSPSSIASAEAFGTATITIAAVTVSPSAIDSDEAFGTAVVSTEITVVPLGIGTEEDFGFAVFTTTITVDPAAIDSEEAFGTAVVSTTILELYPSSIDSEEDFGVPVITTTDITVYPLGIPSEEDFGITFLQGGFIPVTLKKKIRDELVRQAKLGTFITVTYDKDTDELIQGLQVQPQSIEANEVTSNYKIEDAFGRDYVQDWQRWPWVMILRFGTEIIAEAFERSLMDSPICIKRLPGEDRQVHVLLVDAQYTHPPRQEPSNGTVVRYRFQAELSRR